MELIGRVLWWSERDQNGVIIDHNGTEFYFDASVIKSNSAVPKAGIPVKFEWNKSIRDCACAHKILLLKVEAKNSKTKSDVSRRSPRQEIYE